MKKIIIVSITVLLLGIGVFGFKQYNSNQQEKAQKKYDEAVNDFYSSSNFSYFTSSMILSDYSEKWNDAIGSGDITTAVNASVDANSDLIETTNKVSKLTTKSLKTLSEAAEKQPNRYKEIYTEAKKQFSTISAILEQVNNPSGSYITFNQNVNQLFQDFDSNNKMIKMLMDKEGIKEKKEKKDDNNKL